MARRDDTGDALDGRSPLVLLEIPAFAGMTRGAGSSVEEIATVAALPRNDNQAYGGLYRNDGRRDRGGV